LPKGLECLKHPDLPPKRKEFVAQCLQVLEKLNDAHNTSIVSFVSSRRSSREIVTAVDAHGIGIRHGHFYSARLIDQLGIDGGDGVVRVSMVHYNSPAEVDRLIDALDPLI
ncbi:MAG: aminotransferase class V-fold PLP-dependent enzyme, partial [Longimicrobiales bacterium]